MRGLLVISSLLFMLPGYRSLSQDMVVNVELENRMGSFAVIPEETVSLSVVSNFQLSSPVRSLVLGVQEDIDSFQTSNCDIGICTINVTGDFSAPEVAVMFQFSVRGGDSFTSQNLTVIVRTSLNYSCQTYPSPLPFSTGSSYNFTCLPPSGMNITKVVWRNFRSEEEVKIFQAGMDTFTDAIVNTNGTFYFNGDLNETLVVNQSDVTNVAYFYVPSFSLQDGLEIPTAETSIYVIPVILTPQPEFSFEVLLNRASFDEIRCATRSFPPANVMWTLRSEDFSNGKDVADINSSSFALNTLGSLDTLTLTIDGVINMTNLQYNDDGNFTCICSNRYGSSAQWARLRVKSPLRPLWPLLGILGVTILVVMFMSGSYVIEKVSEKQNRARISKSIDNNSADHNAEHGHKLTSVSHRNNGNNTHNSKGKDSSHSAVKRLSSAKPLLEETTTTTL